MKKKILKKNVRGFSFLSLVVLLLFSVLLTSCSTNLSSESLDRNPVLLSKDRVIIDPLQTEEILLGVKNNFDSKKDFYVILECKTSSCEENVILQTFPSIGLEKEVKGVFPIKIIVPEDAKMGEYVYELIVKEDGNVYGSDVLTIEIQHEVERIRTELREDLGI